MNLSIPRNSLARIDGLGTPIDDDLRQVLKLWDGDDQFHEDLEALMFEVEPLLGAELDCLNPWMHAVAMNGGGSAYGLYLHPDAIEDNVAPWVFWEHEDDVIYYRAANTASFFADLLAEAQEWTNETQRVERVAASLSTLGIHLRRGKISHDQGRDWLPPLEAQLKPLAEYLEDSNPTRKEQGLLAYASRNQDLRAATELKRIYSARGWAHAADFSFREP